MKTEEIIRADYSAPWEMANPHYTRHIGRQCENATAQYARAAVDRFSAPLTGIVSILTIW